MLEILENREKIIIPLPYEFLDSAQIQINISSLRVESLIHDGAAIYCFPKKLFEKSDCTRSMNIKPWLQGKTVASADKAVNLRTRKGQLISKCPFSLDQNMYQLKILTNSALESKKW